MRHEEPAGFRSRSMRWITVAVSATLAGIWAWAGSTARVHWDEPSYWYAAAYSSVPQILGGDFQPSGIECFSTSRIGHVLLLKLLTSFRGPGAASLWIIVGTYLLMLVALGVVTHRILRVLRPGAPYARAAVTLGALTPVLVYLAFKTLAEIPAVLLAGVAALAFLRSLRERAAFWLGIAAAALAGVAGTKNHLVVLDVSLVIALVLGGGLAYPVKRILGHALVSGTGALSIVLILLRVGGVPLDRYLGLYRWMSGLAEPAIVRLLELTLAYGPFLLALPAAFLAPARTHARFFSLWFVLATAPLLFSTHVETRYLVGSFVPLAGLVQLSLEGIASRARRAGRARRVAGAVLATSGALLSIAFVAYAQLVMYYGVRKDELATILRRLDESHGAGRYVVVTPSEFTTFLFLRFVEPDRSVCTVFTAAPPDHRDPHLWPAFQRKYYGVRAVQTLEQLAALGDDVVYVGAESDLTVADFRQLLRRVPGSWPRHAAEDLLAAMKPFNPFVLSWMWTDPRVRMADELRVGHYRAMRVTILPPPGEGRACVGVGSG